MTKYEVYVFQLTDDVSRRRNTPAKRGTLPYVYVGYTSQVRRDRLNEHRHGIRSRWAKYYDGALPVIYRAWGPYADETKALAAERRLAEKAERLGYTVVNKTGERITIDPARYRK